ncbi:hypothetical protein NSS64_13290 [Paenibacillus sp. FSL H8-0122]|uniref:hypothetical protein n=1 Tax=Paenibacillus sp. FSL H8-0122 TaxID=2954510 RepID=UPI0030F51EC1
MRGAEGDKGSISKEAICPQSDGGWPLYKGKPSISGMAETRELIVIEKPITIGLGTPCRPNVIEKPITIGLGTPCRPNVIEKPITI